MSDVIFQKVLMKVRNENNKLIVFLEGNWPAYILVAPEILSALTYVSINEYGQICFNVSNGSAIYKLYKKQEKVPYGLALERVSFTNAKN